MSAQERLYRTLTLAFSVIILGFGATIVVVTLANGGGAASTGVLIGILFVAIGAARLFVALRTRS